MKTKIRVSEQVEAFVKSLAPEPRKRLRVTIKGLADDMGVSSLMNDIELACLLLPRGKG